MRSRMGASYEANSFRSAREHCIAHSRAHGQRTGWAVMATIKMGIVGITGQNFCAGLGCKDPHLASAPEIERTLGRSVLRKPFPIL